jgi:hypothetical protein
MLGVLVGLPILTVRDFSNYDSAFLFLASLEIYISCFEPFRAMHCRCSAKPEKYIGFQMRLRGCEGRHQFAAPPHLLSSIMLTSNVFQSLILLKLMNTCISHVAACQVANTQPQAAPPKNSGSRIKCNWIGA